MPDANQTIKKITGLKEKVKKDLANLLGLYDSLKGEVDRKFRKELKHQKGDYNGLEDFYALVMMIKKDSQTVSGASGLVKRLNDLSGFNISEIEEEVENVELEKIFDNK
jgi:hypothetical protein